MPRALSSTILRAMRRRIRRRAAESAIELSLSILLVLVLVLAGPPASAASLSLARTRHFEIYTDLDVKNARGLAEDLEASYAVLWQAVFRTGRDPELHAMVLALRDDSLWGDIGPGSRGGGEVRGFHDADDTLPLLAGSLAARSDPLHSTRHELSHLFINEYLPFRPFWIAEGLAEYLATLETDRKGFTLGKVPELRSAILAKAPLIPLAEILDLRKEDEGSWGSRRADLIYAHCWAYVHFLCHGGDGRHRAGFDRYLDALKRGPDARLADHLDAPLSAINDDFRFYVRKGLYRFRRLDAPQRGAEPVLLARQLSAADAGALRAFLQLKGGAAERARRTLPRRFELPLGHLTASRLAALAGDSAAALAALDEGLSAHPKNPHLLLERAQLLGLPHARASHPERSRLRDEDLRLALEVAPWLAAAAHELARSSLDEGDGGTALSLARRAIAIRGGVAIYYHTLAEALRLSGNLAGAIEVESRALPLARTRRVRKLMADHLDRMRAESEQVDARPE